MARHSVTLSPVIRETVFVGTDPLRAAEPPSSAGSDRIVVIGSSPRSLDMLRLAVVRSDDVVLVAAGVDAPTGRFIDHFAVEHRNHAATAADLDGAAAVLVAIGDKHLENSIVRHARRRGVPVHVADRQLVSDFTILDMFARGAASRPA